MQQLQEPTTAAEVLERARAVQRRLAAQRIPPPRPAPSSPTEEPAIEVVTPRCEPPPQPAAAPQSPAAPLSWISKTHGTRAVQRIVASRYSLKREELLNRSHKVQYSRPRQIAMVLADRLFHRSLPEIGRQFGRDHTTVLNACFRIAKLERQDCRLAAEVEDLSREAAAYLGIQWTDGHNVSRSERRS